MIRQYEGNATPPAVIPAATLASAGKFPETYCGLKSPMFSYKRLIGADPMLGVEMASTGEVACFGANKYEAFLKSIISTTAFSMPDREKGILLSIAPDLGEEFVHQAHDLVEMGYRLYTTKGTHSLLESFDVPSQYLAWESDVAAAENGSAPCVIDTLKNGGIDMVMILASGESAKLEDNFQIRRTAIDFSVPLLTNPHLVTLFVDSLKHHEKNPLVGLEAENLFDFYRAESEADAWSHPSEFH